MRRPERVGIFALDPGSTTALDAGIWRVNVEPKIAVRDWLGVNVELKGTLAEQSREICLAWRQFVEQCVYEDSLVFADLFFTIESYSQRPTSHMQPAEALDPVRLTGLVMGRLYERTLLASDSCGGRDVGSLMPRVSYQSASQAMTYATDERLKDWGAWIKGSDHRRDARRHALARWASLRAT
jgi:hypothetical protein